MVDDGSTDGTYDLMLQYVPMLEQCGYMVDVVQQENQGQSGALQTGLAYIKGEFFTWPDPDDWLHPTSIERMLEVFSSCPDDVAVVRCNAETVDEATNQRIGTFVPESTEISLFPNFFREILFRRTYFAPVCNLARTRCFLKLNPERSIFVRKDAGQNWQIMLPLSYTYGVMQMHEVLCSYLVRSSSHSRDQETYEKKVTYEEMCENVVAETFRRMYLSKTHWARNACLYSLVIRLRLAVNEGRKNDVRMLLGRMSAQGCGGLYLALMYRLALCLKRKNDVVTPKSRFNRLLMKLGVPRDILFRR